MLSAKDTQLFRRFIKEKVRKGAPHLCPLCAENQWELDGFFMIRGIDGDIEPGIFEVSEGMVTVPTVHMMCLNCGYVEQYAWSVVQAWGEKNV